MPYVLHIPQTMYTRHKFQQYNYHAFILLVSMACTCVVSVLVHNNVITQ